MAIYNKITIDGNNNIVVQDSDGNVKIVSETVTELRNLILNMQDSINKIPLQVFERMKELGTNSVEVKGINVYLTTNAKLETFSGIPTGKIIGHNISVTLTNLNKDIRYVQMPHFKLSTPVEGNLDTFMLMLDDDSEPIKFPFRLEYGQQVTVYFNTTKPIDFFMSILEKDPNAYLRAITITTLGEVFTSEQLMLSNLF